MTCHVGKMADTDNWRSEVKILADAVVFTLHLPRHRCLENWFSLVPPPSKNLWVPNEAFPESGGLNRIMPDGPPKRRQGKAGRVGLR